MTILKNKLLFIHILDFFVKCDISLYGNSDLIVKFLCWGKRGVTFSLSLSLSLSL